MSTLEIRQVSKAFERGGERLPVLDDVSISVAEGEFDTIVGPSGSGKSTLFQVVGGLVTPDRGQVLVDGADVTGRRGNIGYMPQQPALLPWRTVEDNVALAREVTGTGRREARAEARRGLARAGLAGFERTLPGALSGGMQQRVAFVRALLSGRRLLCLDEPFSALDALTRAEMQRWLLSVWEAERVSVLFVTHNIEEALLLSSTVHVVSRRPARVLDRVEVPFDRPRREDLVDDPAFVRLRRRLTDQLREEQRAGQHPLSV